MSFNNKPITAKIKRTTKGGMVQQPILNMGGPVKMKLSSPAKKEYDGQSVKPGEDGLGTKTSAGDKSTDSMRAISSQSDKREIFKNEMSKQDKTKADNLAASKLAKATKDKSSYNSMMDKYRSNVSSLNADVKNASKSIGKNDFAMRAAGRKAKEIAATENNLYNYDKKNKPGSTEGYTAKSYTRAKATGTYKSKAKVDPPVNNPPANDPPVNDPPVNDPPVNNLTNNKKSYDQAYKDTRNHKVYGKMDKATYIKEAKRQNASKKAGKGWDASGKGKTVNISNNASTNNTVEPTSKVTKKQEATQSAKNNVAVNTKKKVNTKAAIKPTSKQIRKNASADRKDSRAQRVAIKAKEARTSGNTGKADRLDKREARIKKRASKKRGQAAGAIEVKKKTKKQSFNAVTNQSGYDSFKKAGGLSAWSKGEIEVK